MFGFPVSVDIVGFRSDVSNLHRWSRNSIEAGWGLWI